jgi:hypothetical protein
LLKHARAVAEKSDALVAEGVKLQDRGDHAGALRKYRAALALWPQNGLAHCEMGLGLYFQQNKAAGDSQGGKHSREVLEAFARARRHDPFQLSAYQGSDKEVLRGLQALMKRAVPVLRKLTGQSERVDDGDLHQLAVACQEANLHELALVTRQVIVARRGGYARADYPFIATSLRKLVPGPETEAVLKRLAGARLSVRQLVVPEQPAPVEDEAKKVIDINQLRLYVPIAELRKRVGADTQPLADYVKALQKAAARCLEKEDLPRSRGLLIAVGLKPGKKVRLWCESVEGEMPARVLRKLERELARVEAIEVKGVMAFGLEMKVRGHKAKKYPTFPEAWLQAALRSKAKVLSPPDELFKVLWPDEAKE